MYENRRASIVNHTIKLGKRQSCHLQDDAVTRCLFSFPSPLPFPPTSPRPARRNFDERTPLCGVCNENPLSPTPSPSTASTRWWIAAGKSQDYFLPSLHQLSLVFIITTFQLKKLCRLSLSLRVC